MAGVEGTIGARERQRLRAAEIRLPDRQEAKRRAALGRRADARLARELAAVRAQGYALTYEEMTAGSCSAAAPVVVAGRPVAALGIVLSARRARELPRLVEPLRAAAAGIAGAYER